MWSSFWYLVSFVIIYLLPAKFSLSRSIPVDRYEVNFLYVVTHNCYCVLHTRSGLQLWKYISCKAFVVLDWGPVLTTLLFREKPTFPVKICISWPSADGYSERQWQKLCRSYWAHAGAAHGSVRGVTARPTRAALLCSLGSPASCCVTAVDLWFVGVTAALHLLRSSRFTSECWKLWRCYYSAHAFADGANLVQLPGCTEKMRTLSCLCLLKTCG